MQHPCSWDKDHLAYSNHFILGLNVSTSIPVPRLTIAPCRYPSVIMPVCLVTQSCLTLCKPMNCSLPGSSVHGIFQARILEWVAIYFSRGSSQPRDHTHMNCISCITRQNLYHWATWEAQVYCIQNNDLTYIYHEVIITMFGEYSSSYINKKIYF